MSSRHICTALTIAGSDSGGGAGIEADLKTFSALGVYGMAAITSVTAQNTCRVSRVYDLPPEMVSDQISAVAEDIPIDAAKTGMLSNSAIIEVVGDSIEKNKIAMLVADPVMVSKSGARLLQKSAIQTFVRRILPASYLITPNIPEAQVLTGMEISTVSNVKDAALKLREMGAKNVLIKGGHLKDECARDWLLQDTEFTEFSAPRIPTKNTHGTGCTFSAAITAFLAKGDALPAAIQSAKNYLTVCIRHSLSLGKGNGPLNHFWVFNELNEDPPQRYP